MASKNFPSTGGNNVELEPSSITPDILGSVYPYANSPSCLATFVWSKETVWDLIEWLTEQVGTRPIPTALDVFNSFAPGTVFKVEFGDAGGGWYQIYVKTADGRVFEDENGIIDPDFLADHTPESIKELK